MPLIRETIVVTADAADVPHIAPLGLIAEGEHWIIAPFRPSTTLENLRVRPFAVANLTDDARVFAGCLTGRRDWPLTRAGAGHRLAETLEPLGAGGRRDPRTCRTPALPLPHRPPAGARRLRRLQSRLRSGGGGGGAREPP